MTELIKGLTETEKAEGFSTAINPGTSIRGLKISDGTARVDFDDNLENGVAGSCRVAAIRAQIEDTLKQFPTVNKVIISVNGRTDDILQP